VLEKYKQTFARKIPVDLILLPVKKSDRTSLNEW
jgi:hypothetical protein